MDDFELTEGQKQALDMIEKLMRAETPMRGVLTGFAGTGKTTLIKAISSIYGHPQVLTPTGKAALRVQEATGIRASTIHKWLYQTIENQNTGELEFKRKESTQIAAPMNKLIVVDEASMVGRDLWEDLWDVCQILQLRVLLVGDTFQLSPVEPKSFNDPNYESFQPLVDVMTPHRAHLWEITRQAFDSPVLRASMLIREQSRVDPALMLLDRVFSKNFDDKCLEVHQAGGAVIVHKNDTRHRINSMIRTRLGHGDQIVSGEPLLVLRNTYDIERFNGEVVTFNGHIQYDGSTIPVKDHWKHVDLKLSFALSRIDEGLEVLLSPEQVRGEAQLMTESVIAKASRRYFGDWYADPDKNPNSDGQYIGPPHLHANFGYALTCHKSQGSEWGQVLVYLENSTRFTTYEGRRWLYTAITRAKSKAYFSVER